MFQRWISNNRYLHVLPQIVASLAVAIGLAIVFAINRGAALMTVIGVVVGLLLGLVVVLPRRLNNTLRRRAELALYDGDRWFRLLYENLPDGVLLLDPHDQRESWPIIECNDALCAMNGYQREELIGHTVDILHPQVADTADRAAYLDRLRREGTIRVEAIHRRKDGTLFSIETLTVLITLSGRELVLGIDRDITERRQAEQTRSLMAAIVDSSEDAIIGVALDGTIISWNAGAQRIYGYAAAEVIGQSVALIQPPDRRNETNQIYASLERAESIAHYETVRVRKDGQLIDVVVTFSPIKNARGDIRGFSTIARDITKLKRVEHALEQERALLALRVEERTADLSAANAELARAARLKDEFLASMSHELRTPLNAVLGMTEALREETYGPLSDGQERALQTIEASGRHLLDLINDILDLAKIGAGKLELDIAPVPITTVCHASMRLVGQSAQKKQITLESSIDPALTSVMADARRLKQMLVNLLSNAIKFTPGGGRVGLEVCGDVAHDAVHFTVWDTGIGIAAEQQERLFQPFVQLDSRLARQYEGTGLGLALVYRMAEMHGGGVALSSTVGVGSRFTVSLPWNGAPGPPLAAIPADAAVAVHLDAPQPGDALKLMPAIGRSALASPTGALILLAEDNEATIAMVSDYLVALGYRIVAARNGAEAVARAREARPDLILMDIQMPGMDGLEAARRIRAEAGLATPILALTALAMPSDRERCIAAGADEYISKPISLKALATTIEQYLEPCR